MLVGADDSKLMLVVKCGALGLAGLAAYLFLAGIRPPKRAE